MNKVKYLFNRINFGTRDDAILTPDWAFGDHFPSKPPTVSTEIELLGLLVIISKHENNCP